MQTQGSLFPEFEQPSITPIHSSRSRVRRQQPLTPMPIDLVQLRNEIRAIASPMQAQIDCLALRLDSLEISVQEWLEEINQILKAIQPYEYELVFDRPASRKLLKEALLKVQKQLIIICPNLTHFGMTDWVLHQLEVILNRDVQVKIGYGRLDDLKQGKTDDPFWYGALPRLRQLQHNYPENFQLKALGTHEKFLVCDDFALLGSHNLLTSGVCSSEREVGLRTTDPRIVRGLINRFQDARNLGEQDIASC